MTSTRAMAGWTRPSRVSAGWRGSRLVGKLLMALTMLVLLILFIYPPLLMVIAAFRRGAIAGQGDWTIEPFIEVMTSPATWVVTLNSVVLSVAVAIIALAIGTFLAWVAVRTTTPLRRIMTPTMATILAIPSLFYGLGWYVTLNGSGAPLNILLKFRRGAREFVLLRPPHRPHMNGSETMRRYFAFLAANGYTLTDVEQIAGGVKKQRKARSARSAAA